MMVTRPAQTKRVVSIMMAFVVRSRRARHHFASGETRVTYPSN
jgi:hypothetical protein